MSEVATTRGGAWARAHERSLADPNGFWGDAANGIDWISRPKQVLDDSNPPFYRWFTGGVLNTCYNAVDRHVIAGRADQAALIYDSPVTGATRTYSYAKLLDQVSRFAGVLRALGVEKGDRVVVYLPMVPEAVIAMLGCARIGAVHSVVFGGFAPAELAARIDDARPKVVVTASCGIEPTRIVEYKPMLDAAIDRATHTPDACVVLQRPQAVAAMGERDVDWATAMRDGAVPRAECVPVAATDPLYVLYTSGTTGKPKGIVRDTGGHAVALHWSMSNIYGVHPGEVWWAASDVGWVVGHSYIVYAPLLAGCTTVLYEGKPVGTPDAGAFWRVIAQHGVAALFTAPTAVRAIKKEDPDGALRGGHDASSLRTLFLAGERLDPDTYQWATDRLGVPRDRQLVADRDGLADLREPAGLAAAADQARVTHRADARLRRPGARPERRGGTRRRRGRHLPEAADAAGTLPTLWQDDARYVSSYLTAFEGYYLTGDGGYVDEDGYVYVMGRTDDVLNVAGHRLSTGSLEAAIAGHPAVAECAVIGVHDDLKGQVPRALVVLKAGVQESAETVAAQVVQRVRDEVGAVAALRQVDVVSALPKTRSGKCCARRCARSRTAGPPWCRAPSRTRPCSTR
jgi:propionyl-CoA synthetase